MMLIVSDAGHRRQLRKLISNLLRFLPLHCWLWQLEWLGDEKGPFGWQMFRLTCTLVAKPLQSSSQSSSWAGQRSHDWFTYEMLYERQLSGICAGTRHIAIVFVIAPHFYILQHLQHYLFHVTSVSCNICNCKCNCISLSFFKKHLQLYLYLSAISYKYCIYVVSLCLVLI